MTYKVGIFSEFGDNGLWSCISFVGANSQKGAITTSKACQKRFVLPIPIHLLVSGSAGEEVGFSGIKKMEKCEDEIRVLQVEPKKVD